MLRGVDTTFLVELEVIEADVHEPALTYLQHEVFDRGVRLALSPQVLTEFVHIVTDPRRFERPLPMHEALARAEFWWRAEEVRQVFAGPDATALFLEWMARHRLGRKRILDTYLAATYWTAGVGSIISSNVRDFSVFGCFAIVRPDGRQAP